MDCSASPKYRLPLNANWLEKGWLGEPDEKITTDTLIPAGNMMVAKYHFEVIGGIAPELVSDEDTYLLKTARKAGLSTISDPVLINYHHGNPKNIKQFFKKEVWYGAGISSLRDGIRSKDKPFLISIFTFALLCFFVYGVWCQNHTLPVVATVTYLAICLVSAIDRRFVKKVNGWFCTMAVLYAVYFAARTYSLIYVLKLKRYKR